MNDLTHLRPTNIRPEQSLEAIVRQLQGRMDNVERRVDGVETKMEILARECLRLGFTMAEIQEAIRQLQEEDKRAIRDIHPATTYVQAPVQRQQTLPPYATGSRPKSYRKALIWAAVIAAGVLGVAGGVLLAPKARPANPAVPQPPAQTASEATHNARHHHHKADA